MGDFDKKTGTGAPIGTDEKTGPTVDFDIVGEADGEPGTDSSVMLNIPGRGIVLPEADAPPDEIVIKIPDVTRGCIVAILSGKSAVEVMNFGQLNSSGRKIIFRANLSIVENKRRWSAKDFVAFESEDHPADVVRKVVAKIIDAVGSKPMTDTFSLEITVNKPKGDRIDVPML